MGSTGDFGCNVHWLQTQAHSNIQMISECTGSLALVCMEHCLYAVLMYCTVVWYEASRCHIVAKKLDQMGRRAWKGIITMGLVIQAWIRLLECIWSCFGVCVCCIPTPRISRASYRTAYVKLFDKMCTHCVGSVHTTSQYSQVNRETEKYGRSEWHRENKQRTKIIERRR